ncbi:S9 family peptidase [Dyella psychrodurans]|uniref:S9 family peptidase n=1 Tax=Dyella psychrodurans TaxID=1927960 RepID=A0A370WZS7_9GAMM|nr:S9 family peptidase [Dyella psychrodurans]RDS81507.1 S9 family peptidase [Dyella psychrodurans]
MLKPARLLLPLLAALVSPLAVADTHRATDPRIDALLTQLGKVRDIGEVALSPDGHQLAWVVETNGKPGIVLADANGQQAHSVGLASKPGACSENGLAWAPDSRHLAFFSNCASSRTGMGGSKQPDIYVLDTQSQDKPVHLSSLNGYAHALSWSADGKTLAFLYVEGATRRASALAAAKPQTGEIGVEGIEVQRVATLPAQGGTPQEVTPADSYVYEFSWAPDSQRVAYVAAPAPGDNNWWIAQLYVQAVQPGATRTALVDPHTVSGPLHGLQIALPRWSPDGSRIAFIGGLMSDQGSTGGDIYSVSASGGAPVNLTPGIHVTPSWLSWSSPQSMLVMQVDNGKAELAEYAVHADSAQQQRVLFVAPGFVSDGTALLALSFSADHKQVAFDQSSFDVAPEVYAGAVDNQMPKAVTAINADQKPSWGKARSVEWNNEGFHVQGWLLYPANYDPSKHYPMIVNVHGGPSAADIPHWPSVGYGAAPFSTLGYFVFMTNPRGSFGEGEAFVQANRKDFGYGDLRDTLAGVDAVEKMVPVDDHRLGLTGWSYGGFMSMFAPTQTQRFRAVVAGAGIANWQSYYGQNLIDQWMIPFFGASVYDDPAVYAKSSAINFIKHVKTPTLIVVGERDAECPAPQSFEYWHALRALNVPTSLVVYPNEGHHFYNPANQRDVLQRALNWFERYLPPSE